MEIIIGREEGARRLHCIADGREFNVGQAGTVPTSVSRQHCKLIVNGSNITIQNLKAQNITYVDGNQIFVKNIAATSKVQLGREQFQIPLNQILQLAGGQPAGGGVTGGSSQLSTQTYSLTSLEAVWNEYNERMLAISDEAAKIANKRNLQSLLSMGGVALGAIGSLLGLGPIGIVFTILALLIGIILYIQTTNNDTTQRQLNALHEEFAKRYKCPNPKCGKPFGSVPYRQIEFNKQCFACGCKYTH